MFRGANATKEPIGAGNASSDQHVVDGVFCMCLQLMCPRSWWNGGRQAPCSLVLMPFQMWAVTNASNQCMGAWSTLALSNIVAWGSSAVAKIELTFYGGVPVKRCSDVDTNFEGRAFAGAYVHGLSTPAISVNQKTGVCHFNGFPRVPSQGPGILAPCCQVLPSEPAGATTAAGLGFTQCRIYGEGLMVWSSKISSFQLSHVPKWMFCVYLSVFWKSSGYKLGSLTGSLNMTGRS